jgi:hypothetical protein
LWTRSVGGAGASHCCSLIWRDRGSGTPGVINHRELSKGNSPRHGRRIPRYGREPGHVGDLRGRRRRLQPRREAARRRQRQFETTASGGAITLARCLRSRRQLVSMRPRQPRSPASAQASRPRARATLSKTRPAIFSVQPAARCLRFRRQAPAVPHRSTSSLSRWGRLCRHPVAEHEHWPDVGLGQARQHPDRRRPRRQSWA